MRYCLTVVNNKIKHGISRLWIAFKEGRIVGSVKSSFVSKRNGAHRSEIGKFMVATSTRNSNILLNEFEKFQKNRVTFSCLNTRE